MGGAVKPQSHDRRDDVEPTESEVKRPPEAHHTVVTDTFPRRGPLRGLAMRGQATQRAVAFADEGRIVAPKKTSGDEPPCWDGPGEV